ncbi:MarR family winged helix-turn-helix transcriptional regulator [Rathayibacter tanaceti]|uniref:HTH-type transcriptional regulator MhqR n=2 Tax=Rathayibacter tanaceti TaxID=1671680 RepID=A0A162GJT8_9MICO|nr:MarR family transcriptional regulator [Rathayibacter tanaceti]KZX22359.1 HTH-type transcriptional regulator MhqR [Rathayibacter tanaceti]QHC54602.1 MarR family transcriptional regulator [Rathayibacter tanaceti]TCO37598.1 DNA-binding MarR family transcriptional regulator [Rathayibacter tanaceti]
MNDSEGRPVDAVDEIRAGWAALRPELDTSAIDVVGRVIRASALIVRATEALLAEHGLTRGEFDILTTLRRARTAQSPTSLRTIALASAPAITKRVHSLERRGLLRRSANPADGRSTLIALTEAGEELVDRAFPEVLAIERELLAGVSEERGAEASRSLRAVLASVETAAHR